MAARRVLMASILALILTAAVLGAILVSHRTGSSSLIEDPSGAAPGEGRQVPVLVELFTSEGCSSCPPADELLARLEQSQPIAGAQIIALSEHVDYWNRLGWTDPYSSAEFSARQNDYARALGIDDVYTPQMIVDGRAQFVGSDSARAREVIAGAAREPKANVAISLKSQDASSITLAVRIESLPDGSDDKAEVLVAITERNLRSSVSRGENAGRHLSHTAVVRKLLRLGGIDSRKGAVFSAEPVLRLDKKWKRENLNAVVFVQERKSRRVLGSGQQTVGGEQ